MYTEPIAVFDSGVGGLTFVRELQKLLPNENIVYFGDTLHVPYGTQKNKKIVSYAKQSIQLLKKYHPKLFVIACGTVSSVMSKKLKDLFAPIPYFDVIFPAAAYTSQVTKTRHVGVLATPATVKNQSFERVLRHYIPDIRVTSAACPLFVSMAENYDMMKDAAMTPFIIKRYFKQLADSKIDTLILGCTHFPILIPLMQPFIPKTVHMVNISRQTALKVARFLAVRQQQSTKKMNDLLLCSGDADKFIRLSSILLGYDTKPIVKRIKNYE